MDWKYSINNINIRKIIHSVGIRLIFFIIKRINVKLIDGYRLIAFKRPGYVLMQIYKHEAKHVGTICFSLIISGRLQKWLFFGNHILCIKDTHYSNAPNFP